jgi:ParB family chromosome partitioning protein
MEYALLENLQREDLNPIERARAYARLLSEFSLTQEEVSERVGIDRSSVANTLRLLNLPETIRKDIAEGAISMGHAKVLLALETVELQLQFAQQIKSQGLSIRQLTTMVTAASKKKKTASKAVTGKIPPYIVDLENQILHALGTKVRVIPASGGSGGEIKISYYSLDDLDRILEKLLNSSYENNVNGTDVA